MQLAKTEQPKFHIFTPKVIIVENDPTKVDFILGGNSATKFGMEKLKGFHEILAVVRAFSYSKVALSTPGTFPHL